MVTPAAVESLHGEKRMEEVKHTASEHIEGSFDTVLIN